MGRRVNVGDLGDDTLVHHGSRLRLELELFLLQTARASAVVCPKSGQCPRRSAFTIPGRGMRPDFSHESLDSN